jgi:hypothetical protein
MHRERHFIYFSDRLLRGDAAPIISRRAQLELDSLAHEPPYSQSAASRCSAARPTLTGYSASSAFQLLYDLIRSRIPKAVRINDLSIIDINTKLAKSAPYRSYLCVRFFPQLGRHREAIAFLMGQTARQCEASHFTALRSFSKMSQP